MSLEDLKQLFEFIGGLGLFLYGMNIMADGLQKAAGGRMKRMLGYITNNRLLGVRLSFCLRKKKNRRRSEEFWWASVFCSSDCPLCPAP